MVLFLLTLPKCGHLTETEHPCALHHAEQIPGSSEPCGFIFLTSVAVIMLHFDYELGVVCWLWGSSPLWFRGKLGSTSHSVFAFEFYINGGKKENAASSDALRVRSSGLVKGMVLKENSLPWIDLTGTASGPVC